MAYTSINHCTNANYQVDHLEIAYFEDWCIKHDVLWAHLFSETTGVMVATYDNVNGLTTLAV